MLGDLQNQAGFIYKFIACLLLVIVAAWWLGGTIFEIERKHPIQAPRHAPTAVGHGVSEEGKLAGNSTRIGNQTQAGILLGEAAKRGDVARIQHLVESGVDVNWRREDGYAALHLAAGGGHMQVVKLLAEVGKANLDVKVCVISMKCVHTWSCRTTRALLRYSLQANLAEQML